MSENDCAVKQKTDTECVACVAAMATNTSVEEFKKFVGKDKPPYHDLHFYKYLLKHEYSVGVGFKGNGEKFDEDNKLRIEFPLKDFPAYVVVKSKRFRGVEHAVYWNGKKILDPNPKIKEDGLSLKEYEIISWFPIVKFWIDGEIYLKTNKSLNSNPPSNG